MRRSLVVLVFAALAGGAVAVLACGSASPAPSSDGSQLPPGATRPEDGAPGVCCPPSTGGCANMGGYVASGDCSEAPTLCDNLCDQAIVSGEHGCSVLSYKPCKIGPPIDAGAAPSCPIVGDETDQYPRRTEACGECLTNRCCQEITECYGGGDDPGSTRRVDGGYSACFWRNVCWADTCSQLTDGGGAVGGPCDLAECAPKFDTQSNNRFVSAHNCAASKCGKLPDGGTLCQSY